jgi:hypothetical protein
MQIWVLAIYKNHRMDFPYNISLLKKIEMDCRIPTIELGVGVKLFYLGKSQTARFHHGCSHNKLRGK